MWRSSLRARWVQVPPPPPPPPESQLQPTENGKNKTLLGSVQVQAVQRFFSVVAAAADAPATPRSLHPVPASVLFLAVSRQLASEKVPPAPPSGKANGPRRAVSRRATSGQLTSNAVRPGRRRSLSRAPLNTRGGATMATCDGHAAQHRLPHSFWCAPWCVCQRARCSRAYLPG